MDNIKIAEDFLSGSEVSFLLETILKIEPWNTGDTGPILPNTTMQLNTLLQHSPEAVKLTNSIKDRIYKFIVDEFKETKPIQGHIYFSRRRPENLSLPHRDSSSPEDPLKYACVLYLNNNFDGGDLLYPEQDYKLTPKPGLLTVHDAYTLHAIQPYSGAVRYIILCFWSYI
jgi:hypothetical protein